MVLARLTTRSLIGGTIIGFLALHFSSGGIASAGPFQFADAQSLCTVSNDCHDHATSVNPTPPCVCQCRNKWTGSQCQDCPEPYDATTVGEDCLNCNTALGYYRNPQGACIKDLCTIPLDCTVGKTINVTGIRTQAPFCKCTCLNAFTGAKCSTCPANFDPASCGSCLAGYDGYPRTNFCSPKCTISGNCTDSLHANNVVGNAIEGCNCSCLNKFFGAKCDQCPPNINSTTCSQCVTNYVGFPDCEPGCINSEDCSDHAEYINGTKRLGCTCKCRNKWNGTKCGTCPVGFNPLADCGGCAVGYDGYPNCSMKCVQSDCSNHADTITGTQLSGCNCTCKFQWKGKKCDSCPTGVDAAKDCNECLPGYTSFPTCKRNCELSDCGGSAKALGVGGNTYDGCQCVCKTHWSRPSNCATCPYPWDGNQDCNACVGGFTLDEATGKSVRDCDVVTD